MSINITVKGNPVSIKRGTMIASNSGDANTNNNDIKKRRQMRLQQVRQQSKDIAENIRNKVKKEHTKQLSEATQENTTKLKQWQNRKLLELQTQYQEGLKDIGLGHIQAQEEENQQEKMLEEERIRKQKSMERGFEASQKLQVERNEQSMKAALPVQQKKFAREVENARAAMVSKINESGSKSIHVQKQPSLTAISDSPDKANSSVSIVPQEFALPSFGTTTPPRSKRRSSIRIDTYLPTRLDITPKETVQDLPPEQTRQRKEREVQTTEMQSTRPFYKDTRISDRIRNRRYPCSETQDLIAGPSYTSQTKPVENVSCQTLITNQENRTIETQTESQSKLFNNSRATKSPTKSRKQTHTSAILDSSKEANNVPTDGLEIPAKPSVGIVPSNESLIHLHSLPTHPTNVSRVQRYDHHNRFNSEYLTTNSNIQRIPDESLVQIADSHENEAQLMLRRDRAAQMRGQKALEKERIHRDYQELMQKLPVLQKQERIACICKDKPIYHMDRDRLQEVEDKRQNTMENAYENLFPNVVTLPTQPRANLEQNKTPFRTIDNPEPRTVNTQADLDENQTNLLKVLLANLQQQKGMLEQLETLPEEEHLQNLLDANKEKSKSPRNSHRHKCKSLPNKVLVLQNISTQTSPRTIATGSPKRPIVSIPTEVDGSSLPKKAKKLKPSKSQKPKTKVLKSDDIVSDKSKNQENTANTKTSEYSSSPSSPVHITKVTSAKKYCDCKTQHPSENLCEIRIRIQENDKPEIIITSPKKTKSQPLEQFASERVIKTQTYNEAKRSATSKKVVVNETPISWSEHFMQNSTSSSTTYYSPPNIQSAKVQRIVVPKEKQIDHRLMTYIKKLLELSKAQVDDLNATTVSDVSTPGSSIMETTSNRPMKQLMDVMKLFNLSPMDIATNLNYSKDSSPRVTINSNSTDYDASKSNQTEHSKRYNDTSSSSKSSSSDQSKSGIVSKYAKMADVCHRRISDLTAKIEKIRHEKQQILESHSESDKENSTVYCNIPSKLGNSADDDLSPNSQEEQEQLNRKLIRITSPSKSIKVQTDIDYEERLRGVDDVDSDILVRYIKLKSNTNIAELIVEAPQVDEDIPMDETQEPFVPLFLDIPRLPKLTIPSNNGRRPPPSKGLYAARRFKDDIVGVPHELSTIIEADSVASAKINLPETSFDRHKPKEATPPSKSTSSEDSMPDLLAELIDKVNVTDETKEDLTKRYDTDTSTEKSELESIENMLRTIGMDWAIATLRKTQEALGRTSSSSSSVDLSAKQVETSIKIGKSVRSSNSDSTSFCKEIDLSAISGAGHSRTIDNKERTSTPVHTTTKSSERSKNKDRLFTGESDVSSVPANKDEHYLTIPDVSLDSTNRTTH